MASPEGRKSARGNVSAGCLVRAAFADGTRYLIVHPSGNYNRRAPWSIPKGHVDEGEELAACARRETEEETGLRCRILAPLGEVRYTRGRKTVHAFLAEPLAPVPSPTLEPASWEVDRVEFVPAGEARAKLHPDQRAFLDRAAEALGGP